MSYDVVPDACSNQGIPFSHVEGLTIFMSFLYLTFNFSVVNAVMLLTSNFSLGHRDQMKHYFVCGGCNTSGLS